MYLRTIFIILLGFISISFQETINEFEILANNYYQQGKLLEAAEFYNKAGYAYWNKSQKLLATQAFEKAFKIFQSTNNTIACITISNNLGLIYTELDKYSNALTAFNNTLQYARKAKNSQEIFNALINIANVEVDAGNYQSAIGHVKEALPIATELNNLRLLAKCYSLLTESYDKLGDSKNAYKFFELYSTTDKKIKQQEIELLKNMSQEEINKAHEQKRITEIELKIKKGELKLTQDSLFVAERIALQRQIEINKKTAELEQKELQLKYERNLRRIITISFIIVLGLLASITFMLIRIQRQKKEITLQRNQLNIQNKNITDSLHYGLRIQQAMLPSLADLNDKFETFLIYKPKDIVSGDFYWFRKVQYNQLNYLFIAVVDCTGHGVPGAFMSMIGNRLLNEIIALRQKIQPSEILYLLNDAIAAELHQTSSHTTDGMDIALCRILEIGNNKYELVFAGAKRPLILYSNTDKQFQIVEGNLLSIGNIWRNTPKTFTEKHFQINKNDAIILYTDGIVDQPNRQRQKFGSHRLLNIIESNMNQSFEILEKNFLNAFESFRENEPLRDDVTLFGLRIK